jgi:hypothetical protein
VEKFCGLSSLTQQGSRTFHRREIPPLREPTRSQERTRRKGVGSLRSE